MRKLVYALLTTAMVALVGCVTINVYFPEAAAQKAADRFIGTVIDPGSAPAQDRKPAPQPQEPAPPSAMLLDLLVPAAHAASTPDIRVQTPATEAIRGRMQARFKGTLRTLLDSGAVGFTHAGLVAVHDAGKIPLSQRAQATAAVADENRDRNALYGEIARANGHAQWEPQIRATFAKGWIERAHAGWYYQDASGAWQRK
jgi:uncharacterized protein YdbL (DUF1318 family)